MREPGRLGTAIALPLAVGLFLFGFLSQRPGSSSAPPDSELEALHAGLGVDMNAGTLPAGAAASPTLEDVGPVSEDFRAQLDSLRGVVASDDSNLDAALELASLLQDAHLVQEAVGHFERVLAQAPGNRQAWLDLADSYGAQQQWADVRSAMSRMLESFPDEPSAAYNMGVAYANDGDLDSARDWWTRAMNQGRDLEVSTLARSSLGQIGS